MTLTREEAFEKLNKMLEDVHGYVWMRMAFTHLLDVGFRSFTEDAVIETVKSIKERKQEDGRVPLLTPEAEISLVQTAAMMARMNIWDVLEWARWKIIPAGNEEIEDEKELEEEQSLYELPEGCLSEKEVDSLKSDLQELRENLDELRCSLNNSVDYLDCVEESLDNIVSIVDGDGC